MFWLASSCAFFWWLSDCNKINSGMNNLEGDAGYFFRMIIIRSVQCIESAWLSYRNQRIFRLLKHAVRAAVSKSACFISFAKGSTSLHDLLETIHGTLTLCLPILVSHVCHFVLNLWLTFWSCLSSISCLSFLTDWSTTYWPDYCLVVVLIGRCLMHIRCQNCRSDKLILQFTPYKLHSDSSYWWFWHSLPWLD